MAHETYTCLCCSPIVSEIFQHTPLVKKMAEQSGGCCDSKECSHSGDGISRRAFNQGGAAFAGAALAAGFIPKSAQAQDGEIRVFRGGTILTVDKTFSEAEAIAIRGNKILAVGREADVRKAAGKTAKIVDLKGRTVLPGFIEPHMHFALLAGLGHFEDIGPLVHSTFDEARAALVAIAKKLGPDDWLEARQYDPSLLSPQRELTIKDFEEIAPGRPAFVLNASGHIGYASAKALELAGYTKESPNPPGTELGRFEDGNLNGVLYGPGAFLPVILKNENLAKHLETGFVKAGIRVSTEAAALGVTTLCDQATGALAGNADFEFYKQMYASGEMRARLRASLFDEHEATWDKIGIKPHSGDEGLRVVGWKLVVDGSNQGYTGRQREPYYKTDNRGLFYIEPDALKEIVVKRAGQGWPMVLHGNGDAGIDAILDAVEHAKAKGIDVNALRIRIEHCSILHDDQIARIKALDMCPSFLINHVHYWGHTMRDNVFGPEKVLKLDRCASVEKAGIIWTNHTDAPVSPLGSLHVIRVAVVRDMWKEPQTILAPKERVSVEAAIRGITINAAWQCHSDHEIGSLEPGKLADMVILDEDPRKIEPKKISDIKVRETWMDGKQVFAA
jgi:predicted amidohydrolase YtcJ